MPIKERCLRCGTSWTRADKDPKQPCPGCGEPEWDRELDLSSLVAKGREYEIYDEQVDSNLIITLGLLGLDKDSANTRVPLSHRLKEKFRHQQADLHAKDSRNLVVWFEFPAVGPDLGRWTIASKLRPKWLQSRDRLRSNAATSRALLDELGGIKQKLDNGYDSNIVAFPNWFNFLPTISTASYDELRQLGRIVELGGGTSSHVNHLYESVRTINRAVEAVNQELTVNRARATKDPQQVLGNLWLPAHFAKQEFLSKYAAARELLVAEVNKSGS